jgi:hypothetical protein
LDQLDAVTLGHDDIQNDNARTPLDNDILEPLAHLEDARFAAAARGYSPDKTCKRMAVVNNEDPNHSSSQCAVQDEKSCRASPGNSIK